jgi:hypothetical protein
MRRKWHTFLTATVIACTALLGAMPSSLLAANGTASSGRVCVNRLEHRSSRT